MPTEQPRAWSLRTRLIALLSGVVLCIWLLGSGLIYLESQKQGEELADRALRESALLLLSLAEHEILEHGGPFSELVSPASQTHAHYLVFQIWDGAGRIMYRSVGAAQQPLAPLDSVGYSVRRVNNETWRVYSAWDDEHSLQIQVGETMAHRREMSAATFSELGLFLFFFLPLTIVLIWAIVGRVFVPIESSALAVRQRSPDDLREVAATDAPREVLPLLQALNQLLARVRAALDRERTFTADAAHELRTPLAAIRATAQVLGDTSDPREIKGSVADLLAGVDRSARLVDQLLVLARVDARLPERFNDVDLAELVQSECESQRHFARERGVHLEVRAQAVAVRGDAERLRVLLRNLVDNAIRYTPAEGRVVVVCERTARGVELAVSDSGVGIPESSRQRVFERFYRVVGNDATGSGLGLSIVRRIAEGHDAMIDIRDGLDGGGATFAVLFPDSSDQR